MCRVQVGEKLNVYVEKALSWIEGSIGPFLQKMKPFLIMLRDWVNANEDKLAVIESFSSIALTFAEGLRDMPGIGPILADGATMLVKFLGDSKNIKKIVNMLADLPDKLGSVDGVLGLVFR